MTFSRFSSFAAEFRCKFRRLQDFKRIFYARHIDVGTCVEHHEVSLVAVRFSFASDVSVARLDRLFGTTSFDVRFRDSIIFLSLPLPLARAPSRTITILKPPESLINSSLVMPPSATEAETDHGVLVPIVDGAEVGAEVGVVDSSNVTGD